MTNTDISTLGFESTAEQVTAGLDLTGKTYLVTGCNSGLGKETVRVLASRGAYVIGAARTRAKAEEALATTSADGTAIACELSDPTSVRSAAQSLERLGRPIDAMICNAGVMALASPQTTHGLDLQFLTNHIGHFILVTEAIESLADDGRVVVLSSGAHQMAPAIGIEFDNLSGQRDYDPWKMYGQSKLANILFAKQLAVRFEGSKRTANAVHPGIIRTNLVRHLDNAEQMLSSLTLKTVAQGATTQVLVATHPQLATTTGQYFADCQVQETQHPRASNTELAEKLWSLSEKLVASIP